MLEELTNNSDIITFEDYKNFYSQYIENHKEEYNKAFLNRKYYYKNKTAAILYNRGLQARLLDYDALHTDEFDEELGLDMQEYLILDSGTLTICQ